MKYGKDNDKKRNLRDIAEDAVKGKKVASKIKSGKKKKVSGKMPPALLESFKNKSSRY